mgnify:CR=1 FL=1
MCRLPVCAAGPEPAQNILVAGIIRENGKTIIPSGNDSFCAGDDVTIVTTNTDLTDLRDIMGKGVTE